MDRVPRQKYSSNGASRPKLDLKAMGVAECLAKQVLQMGLQSLVSRPIHAQRLSFALLHACHCARGCKVPKSSAAGPKSSVVVKTKVIVRVVAPHLEPGSATHISIDSLFTREFKILFRTKAGTLLDTTYRAISPLDLKTLFSTRSFKISP